jgi:hypothetical protein
VLTGARRFSRSLRLFLPSQRIACQVRLSRKDLGWGYALAWVSVVVPTETLLVRAPDATVSALRSSPHFRFAKSFVEGRHNPGEYETFVARHHHHDSPLEAVERFQRTIGWVQTQGLRTEVSLDVMAGGQMVLVDGVHRAAAALALGIPLVKGQVVAIVRQKN